MKIFVIAGNVHECNEYCRIKQSNGLVSSNYIYVSSVSTLRGHQDIHGVFIGTWRTRSDITEILDALLIRTTNTDVIKDMYREIGKPPLLNKPVTTKPLTTNKRQPTYSGVSITQELINEASELMHKEIDDAILRDILPSRTI